MDTTCFVTITGLNHYYDKKPFEIGRVFKLIKETANSYDNEAIAAYLTFIEKIGYVANSAHTVYQGTISAGRLYDKIKDYAYAKVMFITHSSVIALVLDKDEVVEKKSSDDNEMPPAIIGDKKDEGNSADNKYSIGFRI